MNNPIHDGDLWPLSFVSHELGTPLTAISGWANLLQSGRLSADQTQRAVENILRSVRLQCRLLGDLHDFSHMAAGRLSLTKQVVDVVSVVSDAIELLRPTADEKEIRLCLFFPVGRQLVSGDPARLSQVAWNLLSNAIKFSHRGSRVEIRIDRVASEIELAVRDFGIGVPASFLPRIFQPFEQVRDGAHNSEGLGLGLTITRYIVDLHDGTITARNNEGGAGIAVTVRLPAVE